jgi:hypothetical protein
MEYILQGIMFIEMKLTKEKTNYILTPESIISYTRKRNTILLRHLLPSLVISALLVVRVFPLFSNTYASHLDRNSAAISISFILTFFLIAIIVGNIVEKYLIYRHKDYMEYKENAKNR